MSDKTNIRVDLSLVFDNNTDIKYIKETIGLSKAEYLNKSETRKSPFKDDNLPGYWSIVTETFETYDLTVATNSLVILVRPYLTIIKDLLTHYNGSAIFFVVASAVDLLPALNFNREFLEIVEFLQAEICTDLYAELVGVEYYNGD